MVSVAPKRKSMLCSSPLAACSNASQRPKISKACGNKKRPKSFSCRRLPKRSNSGAPKPSSKSAKAMLAALWVSLTASLALVTVPSWATATKTANWRKVMRMNQALTFKKYS